MKEINIIGSISVIIFLVFLFYSIGISSKFFIKYQKKNKEILKFVVKHIISIIIFLIIIFLLYGTDINIIIKYASSYISLNIILFDIYYIIARINDKKFKNKRRKENVKWTVIISFISSLILGIISSIKYGSTLYGIPYMLISVIAVLIDFILLIKENRAKNNK